MTVGPSVTLDADGWVQTEPWLINQNESTLAVYDQSGTIKWVLASYAAYRGFSAQSVGGIGLGVGCDSDGNWYTMGRHVTGVAWGDDYASLRKIIDNGDTPTFIAATAGATASSATPTSSGPGCVRRRRGSRALPATS